MRLIDADALIEFCAERWIPLNIDAVNMQPTIQPEKAQLSQEGTTKDAISRQQALEKVRAMKAYKLFEDIILVDKAEVQTELMMLPTAQPEPKEGEWLQIQRCTGDAQPDLECPFCKHRIGWWDMGRYCAGCGAKLEGGAE